MSSWLQLVVAILGILIIPSQVAMVRMTAKLTRMQVQMEELGKKIAEIGDAKNRDHELIFKSMQDDRRATNERLRWLEEHVWNRNRKDAA